jgi:hydroxyacylglutathione hydrolase
MASWGSLALRIIAPSATTNRGVMDHVVTRPTPPFTLSGGRLMVHQVPAWKDNLIWLLVDRATGEAAAVDGPEAEPVLRYCEANGLHLTTILNTHTHGDHIGINRAMGRLGRLETLRVVGPKKVAADVPGLTEPVEDGDSVTFAGVTGGVLLTEGHLDGHISYVFEDVLFCGDTLFGAGCGYLFDGPPATMHASLQRLSELPGETRVCCAHEYTEDNLRFAWSVEPSNTALRERIQSTWATRAVGGSSVPSTIAVERATTPFLRTHSAELRSHLGSATLEASLEGGAAVFAATRALKDGKAYKSMTDADLPLSA